MCEVRKTRGFNVTWAMRGLDNLLYSNITLRFYVSTNLTSISFIYLVNIVYLKIYVNTHTHTHTLTLFRVSLPHILFIKKLSAIKKYIVSF